MPGMQGTETDILSPAFYAISSTNQTCQGTQGKTSSAKRKKTLGMPGLWLHL
jgi:hypothetical protein